MGEMSLLIWVLMLVVLSPIIFGLVLLGLQKPVRLIHAPSGLVKEGYVGYSWTYLVFGWFVPVVRMLTSGWELDANDLHYDLARRKLNMLG